MLEGMLAEEVEEVEAREERRMAVEVALEEVVDIMGKEEAKSQGGVGKDESTEKTTSWTIEQDSLCI